MSENSIRAQCIINNDREVITRITIVANGIETGWIGFDVDQLDALIAMLNVRKQEMIAMEEKKKNATH